MYSPGEFFYYEDLGTEFEVLANLSSLKTRMETDMFSFQMMTRKKLSL